MWECWRSTPVEDVAQYYTSMSTLREYARGIPHSRMQSRLPDGLNIRLTQTIVHDP